MLQVNINALVHLTRLLVPGMIARRRGRILNLGSTAGFQPGPGMTVYYASKAFVNSFTAGLAYELKGTGVTATVVCPAPSPPSSATSPETAARACSAPASCRRRPSPRAPTAPCAPATR
jgi:short-subunit dehydrogenase